MMSSFSLPLHHQYTDIQSGYVSCIIEGLLHCLPSTEYQLAETTSADRYRHRPHPPRSHPSHSHSHPTPLTQFINTLFNHIHVTSPKSSHPKSHPMRHARTTWSPPPRRFSPSHISTFIPRTIALHNFLLSNWDLGCQLPGIHRSFVVQQGKHICSGSAHRCEQRSSTINSVQWMIK
jgi:hypothetical protein